MESKPTHEQAQLHLQIFEMRREVRLRQARDWFFKNYHVQTLDDVMRIASPGTEGGTFANMVLSYWEQACTLLNYGLLHEELFFKTSGEFFGVWDMSKAVVPQMRELFKYNGFMEQTEKAAKAYEAWSEKNSPGHIATMREFMKKMMSQQTKAA